MEKRKNDKKNIYKKSGLFFNVGLILSIGLVISAFEWRSYENDIVINLENEAGLPDETVLSPITFQEPPPPPPKPTVPQYVEQEPTPKTFLPPIDLEPEPETPINPAEFVPTPEPESVEEAPLTLTNPDRMPEPQDGMKAFYKTIGKELKYPTRARANRTEGKVFVQFIIDTDGAVTNVEVIKGISPQCDEEAVRVIKNSKKWNPGKQRGKPVRVKMVLPITFLLS